MNIEILIKKLTRNKWLRICIESANQSGCYQWFQERYPRITCSKRAHQIKTRVGNLEILAMQFKQEHFDGQMTAAMAHGIKTKPEVRNRFVAFTNLHGDFGSRHQNQPTIFCR